MITTRLYATVFTLIFIIPFISKAQDKVTIKMANEHFNYENFNTALDEYLTLLKLDPENKKLNYRVGVCYLNTNRDKSLAVSFLEKVIELGEPDPNTYYLLGRAYHFAYRFNDAISMFEKFKQLDKGNTYNLEDVEKQIEYCYNAIELMKFPLNVSFDNLGPMINSEAPDYYSFVPEDESFLIFNTKRNDGSDLKPNGSYHSEIYISTIEDGKYTKAHKIDQNINTLDGSEEIIGLSSSGKYLLYSYDHEENPSDLFIANYISGSVQNVKKLPKVINSKKHEIAASIVTSGDAIYFASDMDGGYGGVDIYVSRKLPNGKWGPAQNLGPSLNTKFDEDFPNISSDGKTLYFSSKGHTSMGGYDIFKATFDPVKRNWSNVKNLGYPLNTPEDNMNYRASKTGRTGYISALRENGFGDLDIYSVTFHEVDPEYSVIKGYIQSNSNSEKLTDAFISVLDLQTDEEYGSYLPNPISGRFIMILPPGEYNVLVEMDGFETYSENIEVLGKSSRKSLIKKNITLKKSAN